MIDPSTEFGAHVAKRLQEERVVWLTTLASDGTPQPNPVWFYWDGETVLVYSQPTASKLRNISRCSKVSVNLEGADELGGDIVVITGDAFIDETAPKPDSRFIDKYREVIAKLGQTAESLAASYSVAIRVRPNKIRGF
jgi:PPOX class probable F420-dependent enzyme